MVYKIKFGTDGWRGFIAEDYTFDNVRRCAQGFANYLLEQGRHGALVGGASLKPDEFVAITKSASGR